MMPAGKRVRVIRDKSLSLVQDIPEAQHTGSFVWDSYVSNAIEVVKIHFMIDLGTCKVGNYTQTTAHSQYNLSSFK